MAGGTGLGHWRIQRMTAVVLVPLALWFAYAVVSLTGSDYGAVRAWAGNPLNGLLMATFLLALFRHAQIGVEEVIQDYVQAPCIKYGALMAVRAASAGLVLIALVAIAVLVFGG